MKNNFEQRKQNRIDYAREQAEKQKKDSERYSENANSMASHIPMGQPILVGHHSEKTHRRHLGQIWGNMEKATKADGKAQYYADKAKAIESNKAIFSDDPEAVRKLESKIERLEKLQDFMKSANRLIKKQDKGRFLELESATEQMWDLLNQRDSFGNLGFAPYKLTNNNANIKRLKIRLSNLKAIAEQESTETEINGIRLVRNVEANRIQLFFPDIPSADVRQSLKKTYGFRWCRTEGAWQRHLNNVGIHAANGFLKSVGEKQDV